MRTIIAGTILVAVLVAGGPSIGAEPVAGYLKGADIGYVIPPRPMPGSEIEALDLWALRSVQVPTNSERWAEATEDAKAYDAPDMIQRFSASLGTVVNKHTNPILVYVLKRASRDASQYAGAGKSANTRNRPYAEHKEIAACFTTGLVDDKSYPSGHSTNGFTMALILADLMPNRAQTILARGARYGDNRVVCGVHYPLDVEQGRKIATAYVSTLRNDPVFRPEFECAKHEFAVNIKLEGKLSPECADLQKTAKQALQ